MTSTIKEYAAALFSIAQEVEKQAVFADALQLVADQFTQNPAYVELLNSPGISKAERLAALDAAFADTVPPAVLIFLHLLCENGHMHEFDACVAAYMQFLREEQQISMGKVTSAVPLQETEKQALLTQLETLCGHKVTLVYETDPTLLGGLTVTIDGKILDGSLQHRLRKVKEVIAK